MAHPQEAKTDSRSGANENKFLSFRLGGEEYGVEILRVREIIGIIDITPLPQTPNHVKGVINLRGKIIPVIELRRKFAMEPADFTEETCVIVVEVSVGGDGEMFQMGVIVDTVSEVLDIARERIEPAPRFGGGIGTSSIMGMGKVRDKVLILLDIDKVLWDQEVEAIASGPGSQARIADETTRAPARAA